MSQKLMGQNYKQFVFKNLLKFTKTEKGYVLENTLILLEKKIISLMSSIYVR